MSDRNHILDAIGNTPLVELRRIVPKGSARITLRVNVVEEGQTAAEFEGLFVARLR